MLYLRRSDYNCGSCENQIDIVSTSVTKQNLLFNIDSVIQLPIGHSAIKTDPIMKNKCKLIESVVSKDPISLP